MSCEHSAALTSDPIEGRSVRIPHHFFGVEIHEAMFASREKDDEVSFVKSGRSDKGQARVAGPNREGELHGLSLEREKIKDE